MIDLTAFLRIVRYAALIAHNVGLTTVVVSERFLVESEDGRRLVGVPRGMLQPRD